MTTRDGKKLMTPLMKLQVKLIRQMNFTNILERKKLGDKVSKKAEKEVIFLYDENIFCEKNEKIVEQYNKVNGYSYTAPTPAEIKIMNSEHLKRLTCIVDDKQYCVIIENNKNERFEEGVIDKNYYWKCVSVAISENRRLFIYIYRPKGLQGHVLKELVKKYKDKYEEKLKIVERIEKAERLLSVV